MKKKISIFVCMYVALNKFLFVKYLTSIIMKAQLDARRHTYKNKHSILYISLYML